MSTRRYTVPSSEIQLIMASRLFQVRDQVWLKEDLTVSRPGVGTVLYAAKGELVQIMSYDPAQECAYGVRSLRKGADGKSLEFYRNAAVKESSLSRTPVNAESLGL